MNEIGSATFGLVVGLGRFRSDLGKGKKEAEQGGKKMGDGLADGIDQGVRDGGSKIQSSFDGILSGLKKGAIAAGIAAGAALTAGTLTGLEQGQASDKLAAQLGISEERSAELGKVAGRLYADAYGESFGDVNQAIRSVLQSGAATEDIDDGSLERLTAKAIDLGTAFEQDVGRPAEAAGQLVRNGLAANADEAFDIITRGFQEGADKAEDLLDTYREYSTMFRDIGIDGATATGLFVQGLQAGARDTDTVADALKEFAIRGQDASEASADGYKLIGLSAKDMTKAVAKGGPSAAKALDTVLDRLRATEDPVKRNAAAVALFGTKAEDLGDALFALDPSQATARLGTVTGAAEKLGDTLNNNAATKIETFKRGALQGLTDFIGGNVIPGVERLHALFEEEGLGGILSRAGTLVEEQAPILGQKLLTLGREFVDWVQPQIEPFLGELGGLIGAGAEWLLSDGVPLLVEGTSALVPALIDWVGDEAIPGLVGEDGVLWDFLDAFVDWVREDGWDAFKEGGADLGKALIEGMADSLKELGEALFDDVHVPFLGEGGGLLPEGWSIGLPGFADGGRVSEGRPIVVGEKRPEVFVPDDDGTILPRVPHGFADDTYAGQMMSQADVEAGNQMVLNGAARFEQTNHLYGDDKKATAAEITYRAQHLHLELAR